MTDLSDIQPKERTIEIKHPGTKAGLGIFVSLVSQYDAAPKRTLDQIMDRTIAKAQRKSLVTAAEQRANSIALVRSYVTGWDWSKSEIEWKGEKPPFTKEKLTEVLTEVPWFFDQLNSECGDTEAFF